MIVLFTIIGLLGLVGIAGSWVLFRKDPDDLDNTQGLLWGGLVFAIAGAVGLSLSLNTVTDVWAGYLVALSLGSLTAVAYIRWRIRNYREVRAQFYLRQIRGE